MSIILRPKNSRRLQVLPLLASFAVADAIMKTYELPAFVRWPNDVTIDGRKVSGAIAESSYTGAALNYVIVGLGVNCNSPVESIREVTSLVEELGQPIKIGELRDAIISGFAESYAGWARGTDMVAPRAKSLSSIGKKMEIHLKGGEVRRCVGEGLRADGALVVKGASGREVYHAEDVERVLELDSAPKPS